MKLALRILMLMLLAGPFYATAADDFEPYSIIIDRNIFNPNRQAGVSSDLSTTPTTATESISEPVMTRDSIDLLGTWISDKQSLAFTEGSRTEFSATPSLGEELGGWRIAAIDTEGIVLTDADRSLRVQVGQRIERGEGEDWQLTERGSLSSTPTIKSPSESKSGGGVMGSASEILKRMRERREKENQK